LAGTLYVVATPIGNLEDITIRAARVLGMVDRVVAEDTRRTRALLSHLGIEGKTIAPLEAHASASEVEREAERLREGQAVALVTDAGVPSVSDPGAALIRAAVERGARVVPIPGPSAVTAAVAASGFVSGGFWFVGFLPRGGPDRADLLTRIAGTPEPVVLFESKMRLADSLRELAALMPDRHATVAREMTKIHEEFVRGSLAELATTEREWIGEITIVLGPYAPARAAHPISDEELDQRIDRELSTGIAVKAAAQRVAAWSGRSRREVYERAVTRRNAR
jgi:16S rRNA (cytidine1402-2'-O)-methyltransferase